MNPKLLTKELITSLLKQACCLPRLRTNHNFHSETSDPIQRMVVAMKKGTYIRPHRHFDEQKWEFAIALSGRMQILLFNTEGLLLAKYELAPQGELIGIEVPFECFHTWLPLTEEASFFEFKSGPYSPQFSSQFPQWAPEETSRTAHAFLNKLSLLKTGESCI
jgi:cupin fold WbuC family metalloprotein